MLGHTSSTDHLGPKGHQVAVVNGSVLVPGDLFTIQPCPVHGAAITDVDFLSQGRLSLVSSRIYQAARLVYLLVQARPEGRMIPGHHSRFVERIVECGGQVLCLTIRSPTHDKFGGEGSECQITTRIGIVDSRGMQLHHRCSPTHLSASGLCKVTHGLKMA